MLKITEATLSISSTLRGGSGCIMTELFIYCRGADEKFKVVRNGIKS